MYHFNSKAKLAPSYIFNIVFNFMGEPIPIKVKFENAL